MKILSLLSFLLFSLLSDAQVTVVSGTTVQLLAGTSVTVRQNININSGGAMQAASDINIEGNLKIDGNLQFTNSAGINFTGSTAQQISGTNATIPWLRLNNSNGLTLTAPITITDHIQLDAGSITTGSANAVHFSSAAINPVETNSKRIIGTAIMDARPLGTGALTRFLNIELSAGENIGNLSVTRITGPEGIITANGNTSIAANWIISPSVATTLNNRTAAFSWLSALDNGKDMTAVNLWSSPPPYTAFTKISNSPQNVSAADPRFFTQPAVNINNNKFTLTDASSVIPVKLLSFAGQLQKGDVLLQWKTENETDMHHYEVERSVNAMNFTSIGSLSAKGINGLSAAYDFIDSDIRSLKSKVIFYRLKQVNTNGSFKYSNIVSISPDEKLFAATIYPNPFTDRITLSVMNTGFTKATVEIIDASGRTVHSEKISLVNASIYILTGLQKLQSGVYTLKITAPLIQYSEKLIKYSN